MAIDTVHYYNNTISIGNVVTSEKQNDFLSNAESKSNDGSDFDALQEAYHHMHSQWLKVYKENKSLVRTISTLLNSKEDLECK